ncbi:Transposase DDE domain protein [Aquisphaera giovannonii]|uniref:Transposase DDE domain protein n=1 Tax=Aquisphaera giovannonii TaxID=406548 RepID=A0A5B9VXR1_9BACT|nr:Transposase DDE domain protein [Aquisphaera giovannonii]
MAIDGKTLRGSFDRASGKAAIHMVSAWATANRLSLGQVVVDGKSNELTAIPAPLRLLELKGCLVTIDAMGCRTAIAEAILEHEADYVLAVKDNQPTLHRGIQGYFVGAMEDDFAGVSVSRHETKEEGHGRVEHRAYYVCDAPAELPDRGRWEGERRGALLHPQPPAGGEGVRRCRLRPLDDREFAALATRCDLRRGRLPRPPGPSPDISHAGRPKTNEQSFAC